MTSATADLGRRLLGPLLPLGTGLLAALLAVTPGGPALTPLLSLAVIFHWSLTAPALMPPWSVVLIGFVLDIVSGLPLGLGALAFLLALLLVRGLRPYLLPHGFLVTWAAFAFLALVTSLLRWLLATAFWGHLFPLRPSLAEAVLTAACYPVLGWLLAGLGCLLPPTSHAAGS